MTLMVSFLLLAALNVFSCISAPLPTPELYTIKLTPTIMIPWLANPASTNVLETTSTDIPSNTAIPSTETIPSKTIVTSSSSETISIPISAPNSTSSTWVAPAQMTDLSPFSVSQGWQHNDTIDIVDSIPPEACATLASEFAEPTSQSIIRVLYPADSINPAQRDRPRGGAEFYASPLDISNASTVSLSYSIFFPLDFDWVLAGKLPGMYGGHTGCSGGDDALDCFSTRLMWRKEGKGELYLYAPKDKQTDELCDDPASVCDAAYGFSIGRDSFSFTPGAWTHVKQTVTLNKPGMQDGHFALDVNGERVIERADVFYRDLVTLDNDGDKGDKDNDDSGDDDSDGDSGDDSDPSPLPQQPPQAPEKPPQIPENPPQTNIGGLGGLLGGLLGSLLRKRNTAKVIFAWDSPPSTSKTAAMGLMTSPAKSPKLAPAAQQVGFVGIFFSTFFGGHDPKYATPRDQYTYFKDFMVEA